jgi:hypothetical protein
VASSAATMEPIILTLFGGVALLLAALTARGIEL